jgi:hypothetical protein
MLNRLSFIHSRGPKQLSNLPSKSFAGINFKRKPTKKGKNIFILAFLIFILFGIFIDLPEYDVVIVGSNMGGLLSKHFDAATHGHYSTMTIFGNSMIKNFIYTYINYILD